MLEEKAAGEASRSVQSIIDTMLLVAGSVSTAAAKYKEIECSEVTDTAVSVLVDAGSGGGMFGCMLDDRAYSEWHVQQRACEWFTPEQ